VSTSANANVDEGAVVIRGASLCSLTLFALHEFFHVVLAAG
jgi:hypothetical protein